MAIKSSNQITFTEQKKIVKIEEWYLATSNDSGVTITDSNWTEEVQTIDETKRYLWNYEKVIYSLGEPEVSEPAIIGVYGGGSDGKGIANIKNYYQVTTDTNPPTSWIDTVPMLDSVNKYLWNYEVITYTSGDPTETDPAIIGVYGDSGTDAVSFEIYSTDGFIFKEGMAEIKLQVAAFEGDTEITGAQFTWSWFDNNNDTYITIIENTEAKFITIGKDSAYALANLKCTMTYKGRNYEDYASLSNETILYSATVNFFDGNNVFNNSSEYLIAYVNLYKNNSLVETILTDKYYIGNNSVSSNTITTDLDGTFSSGDLVYFICKIDGVYCAVLGEYGSSSWNVYNYENEYVYVNDLYDSIPPSSSAYSRVNSNVVVISKEDVSRSRIINFSIYKKQIGENGEFLVNNELYLSSINTTAIDVNDPIISDIAPENVKFGQLWLDTSSDPYVLKIYTKIAGTEFILGDAASDVLTVNTTSIFLYGDKKDIIVSDDGSMSLDQSCETTEISYAQYQNANILKGKFYMENETAEVYYMSSDAEITRNANTSYGVTFYTVSASLVQPVSRGQYKGEWKYFSQQNGGAIYTSKPSFYQKGDLWILAEGEICGEFGPGTMLKAITDSEVFDESHWIDSMDEITTTIKNVKESLLFDDTGLKVMKKVTDSNGNVKTPFYVGITSERMGFHSKTYNDDGTEKSDVEVVHIGNNSATIQNVTFEGNNGTTFNNSTKFNREVDFFGFVWTKESNGSLSFAILD